MKIAPINGKTRIYELIKANPQVIDTLADFNPHFRKLQNPILRNLLARRVSILEACRIGGCQLSEFMERMSELGFTIDGAKASFQPVNGPRAAEADPAKGLNVVELDVRPMLANGDDPLKAILALIKDLGAKECLKVINTFEPIPLINLLKKQGYISWTRIEAPDLVCTWFARNKGEQVAAVKPIVKTEQPITAGEFQQLVDSFQPDRLHTIDVRELEMPLPMIKILEELQSLKIHEALFVYHKKLPIYLLPELAERGFKYYTENSAGEKVNMLIFKV